jgi:hypothetical protein
MFWKNMSPPSSGLKNKISKRPAGYLLQADFLIGLFFDPEDESNIFLRNVG